MAMGGDLQLEHGCSSFGFKPFPYGYHQAIGI